MMIDTLTVVLFAIALLAWDAFRRSLAARRADLAETESKRLTAEMNRLKAQVDSMAEAVHALQAATNQARAFQAITGARKRQRGA